MTPSSITGKNPSRGSGLEANRVKLPREASYWKGPTTVVPRHAPRKRQEKVPNPKLP